MKRLILILLFCLSTLIAYNQDLKPKTLTTVGYSFTNELSVSIGGTYIKNVYVGLDHYQNLSTKHQSNYLGVGLYTDKAYVIIKYGVKTLPYDHTHIHKMDYGVEYLWMFDKKWCYGLAFTKQSGIQFKLGLTLWK